MHVEAACWECTLRMHIEYACRTCLVNGDAVNLMQQQDPACLCSSTIWSVQSYQLSELPHLSSSRACMQGLTEQTSPVTIAE